MGRSVGRWELLERVARGGMGEVWRARGPDGVAAALKLLLAGKGASPVQRERFAREARVLARLLHPHVVALLDHGEEEGAPWLVVEWVEGETLERRLAHAGPLDPGDALDLVRRLGEGLAACHALGVLHRDLKPANVLLRAGSIAAPLLGDFGLARELGPAHVSLTQSGASMGTPGWWPPEQARGDLAAIGPRSDVYGLGALLYACLTGVSPQEGETLAQNLVALARPPTPPSRLRPDLPRWLDAPCLAALDPDPARRPADVAAFLRLLTGLRAAGATRTARPPLVVPLALLALAASLLALAASLVAPVATGPTPATSASAPSPGPATPADDRARRLDTLVAEAQAKHRRGDRAGAVRDYTAALELAPERAELWNERGVSHTDPHAALSDYDRALELDPDLVKALSNRGIGRGNLGDTRGALIDLDRALTLAPDWLPARINRAHLLQNLGRVPEALLDYERALATRPTATLHFGRGQLRLRLNDVDGALVDLDRALVLDANLADALAVRAGVRARLGDPRGALADAARALELAPSAEWAASLGRFRAELVAQLDGRAR